MCSIPWQGVNQFRRVLLFLHDRGNYFEPDRWTELCVKVVLTFRDVSAKYINCYFKSSRSSTITGAFSLTAKGTRSSLEMFSKSSTSEVIGPCVTKENKNSL